LQDVPSVNSQDIRVSEEQHVASGNKAEKSIKMYSVSSLNPYP